MLLLLVSLPAVAILAGFQLISGVMVFLPVASLILRSLIYALIIAGFGVPDYGGLKSENYLLGLTGILCALQIPIGYGFITTYLLRERGF